MSKQQKFAWENEQNRKTAEQIVEKMTVEEAAEQLLHGAKANERLGIPEYNWWSEGLHGVARAGTATVFPQAIGMAAMFDDALLKQIAEAISMEARAKHNAAVAQGDRDIYKGLTYWSPNINIFRDPRWGRGHETYGEDPYLTARLGVAFIEGLQGEGKYLRIAACAKHFAVHSGPEALRHEFDAKASPKDLNETYLPAFRAAVQEAGVETVMGAYNRTNGEPCCGSKFLLEDTLRGQWKFDGHVVSDCWAVRDFHENHKYTKTPAESASLAVHRGCDINCGCTYEHLLEGLAQGLVTEAEIRRSAVRAMQTRARLGMFARDCEYDKIPYTVVNQKAYQELALRAAEESLVLLENRGALPLANTVRTIGVIGPNAYTPAALYGNYHGDSGHWITNLDGIREEAERRDLRVLYSKGCDIVREQDDPLSRPGRLLSEAATVAQCSDVVVLCVGLDETLEGEQGDTGNFSAAGDKRDLLLPKAQRDLCDRVFAQGKPVILVVNAGSSLDISAYANKAQAVLWAWYSGEKGGLALANVLFGKVSPSGRLPLTFYYNDQPLPDFTDYSMRGRTYRYVRTKMLYPFGFGRSFTTFALDALHAAPAGDGLAGSVRVKNTGAIAGDTVVQCYLRYEGETFEKPSFSLAAFQRVGLAPGESREVPFALRAQELESVLEDGTRTMLPGIYTLYVGGNAPDARSVELTGQMPMWLRFEVKDGAVCGIGQATAEKSACIAFPEPFEPAAE